MGNNVVSQRCLPQVKDLSRKQCGEVDLLTGKEYKGQQIFALNDRFGVSKDYKENNHWLAVSKLRTNIVRPLFIYERQITYDLRSDENKLPKVGFLVSENTLSDYSTQSLQTTPLMCEVRILNVLSNITDALVELHQYGIVHGNVSPDTIIYDGNRWLLATPHFEHTSLRKRIDSDKESLQFLLPPETAQKNSKQTLDQSQSDLYSLAISVIHTLDNFPIIKMAAAIPEEDWKAKLSFLSNYYSQSFIDILAGILTFGPNQKRMTPFELQQRLNLLIDLN